MSQTCIVVSKSEALTFHGTKEVVLCIEDYIQPSNVAEARKLTDKIFAYNTEFIEKYDHNGYKVAWSWYSDIFQFCIKCLEIKTLLDKVDNLNPSEIIVSEIDSQYEKVLRAYFFNKDISLPISKSKSLLNLKSFLFNVATLLFSIFSFLFFALKPGKNVGSYTGDFVYKNTRSDFRLNHLYEKYKENNIRYIEFIRNTTVKNFLINILKRRRFAIYYDPIIYFVNLFIKNTEFDKKPKNFYESVLFNYHNSNLILIKASKVIEKIFKILKINKFVLISFSSRSAPLLLASKSLGIKTIGIMHGLQQKEYAVYEFMESYDEQKKIGCDVYGVWSTHYLKYFKKYSKISDPSAFKYSGLLRPVKEFYSREFDRVDKNKIKVLLVSEPLVSVEEIAPYIKSLLKCNDIELGIKIRPMYKDIFFSRLKKKLPIVNNCKVYDGKIEDVAKDFDVFLGSNSTAVIEASLFGKLSILVDTVKFGDYFEMDSILDNQKLLVRSSESIYESILYRVNNESSLDTISTIRDRFFGDNKDGAQWVVDQL